MPSAVSTSRPSTDRCCTSRARSRPGPADRSRCSLRSGGRACNGLSVSRWRGRSSRSWSPKRWVIGSTTGSCCRRNRTGPAVGTTSGHRARPAPWRGSMRSWTTDCWATASCEIDPTCPMSPASHPIFIGANSRRARPAHAQDLPPTRIKPSAATPTNSSPKSVGANSPAICFTTFRRFPNHRKCSTNLIRS